MGNNRIQYNVDFNINQQQLQALKNELTQLQNLKIEKLIENNPSLDLSQAVTTLKEIKQSAGQVQNALSKAFNIKLNVTNFSTLREEIQKLNLDNIYKNFQKAGTVGMQAFNKIPSAVMRTNLQLKETNKFLDSMATTLVNTAKWGVASSALNSMTGAVQKAWSFTKELDTSLNNIRIVTSKSADEMERFARVANSTAKTLGKSTKDYTDAALIYYQQGLTDEEAQTRANITLKASNVTGQSTDVVSEQLTAVWNGYKVAIQDSEKYIDKLAAVAAETAADLEELSVGMSKVASAANIMGVDIDQLSATLATVISVTRQAPESVGTAFKTIYARMGDISAGIDTETSLDAYTQEMYNIAKINVLDTNNQLRDMGEVIEEVGEKWTTLSREQQIALSQVMAGTRQYNNLLSLFDNWDMYTKTLETSKGSIGELNKQQDIYMESTKAHLEQLGNSWERVFDSFVDTKGINSIIDLLTGATTGVANFIEALGGGAGTLLNLGAIGTQVFSKQIAHGINISIKNMNTMKENAQQLQDQLQTLLAMQERIGVGSNIGLDARIEERKKLQSRIGYLDNDQIQKGNDYIDAYGTALNDQQAFQLKKEGAIKDIKTVLGDTLSDTEIEDVFNEGSDASGKFGETIENNRSKLDEYREALENLLQTQKEYITALQKQEEIESNKNSTKEEVKQANDNRRSAAKNFSNSFKEVRKNMSEMTKATVDDNTKNMLQETNDKIKNIKAPGQTKDALKDLAEQTETIAQDVDAAIEDVNNSFNKMANNVDSVTKDVADCLDVQLEGAVTGAKKNMDKFFEDADREALINNVTKLASGFTQVASAMINLSNLGDILSNDNLSTWEKFLQIVMNLGMSLPMLINGITEMRKNWSSLVALGPKITQGLSNITTALMQKLGINKVVTGSNAALALSEQGVGAAAGGAVPGVVSLDVALKSLMWPITLIIAAIALLAAGIYGMVKAFNADADAAKEAAEAHKMAKEILNESTESYNNLVEAMDKYSAAVENLKDKTKDYTESLREANEAAMELIKNDPSLAKQAKRNSDGLIVFEESNEQILDRAQDKYTLAKSAEHIANIQSNEASLKNQRTEFIRSHDMDWWWDLKAFFTGDALNDDQMQQIVESINKNGGLTEEDLRGIVGSNESLIDTLMETDNREQLIKLAETTERLNATNKLLLDESLRASLEQNDTYNKMTEAEKNAVAEIYGEGLTDEEKAKIEKTAHDNWYQDGAFGGGNEDAVHAAYAQARGWTLSDNKAGDKAVYIDNEGNEHEIEDDSARAYLVQKQIADDLGKYNTEGLEKIMSGIAKISDVGEKLDTQTASQILGFASKKDTTFEESNFSLGAYNELQGMVNSGEFLSSLSEVTEEEWKTLGYNNAQEYVNAIKAGLENYDTSKGLKTSLTNIAKVNDNADNLRAGIQSGDITYENISENEDYKAVLGQLEEIKGLYPEVTAAANVLNETWLVGTQEYMEALELVQDKIYKAQVTNLTNEANEQIDELFEKTEDGEITTKLNVDSDDFYNQMDELLDAEYKIDIAVHTEAEREFESIVAAMNNMNEQASKIGDNFIVAADDVRGLNNAFPGIIQNIKDLGDGTVQLNEDVVESAMNMAQAEIAADSEATIAKLQNQATILRQKQTTYQNMANAASALAQMEVTTDDTAADQKAIISENLAKLKSLNDELETQSEMDNDQAVADASNANGEVVAKNWNSAYQSAAKSSYSFAVAAIQNMKAASGQGSPTTGNFGVNYNGSTGVSSEAKTLEGTQSLLEDTSGSNQNEWAKLAQKYQMLANQSGAAANDIEGMIAGIGAKNADALKKLNGVKKGLGADGKKNGGGKDPDQMDKLEDAPDRYHEVNTQLDKISNHLDKIQSQEKKLTGAKLIENINAQLDKLNDRLDQLKKKVKIAEGEAGKLRSGLAGAGVLFNNDGTISNYEEIYNQKLAYVNGIIDKYNNMSATEQETYKQIVEQAKQEFDKFTEDLDRYDELISDEIPGLQNDIQDAIDEQIELNIKKFNLEFDIRLNLKDATKDWNEFKKRILDGIDEDDIYGNAVARVNDDFTNMIGENGVQASAKQAEQVLAELKEMDETGWSDVYGNDRVSALEDLKTAYETVNEDLIEIDQIQKDIHQAWLDTMDEINEKMADQVAMYEQISNIIDHDMKLIELVYGEQDYEALEQYYEKQHQNNLGLLDFQRQNADFWKKEMDSIVDKNSEEWKKARDNWISATNDLNATIEASIENARDKMENAIDKVFDKFNDEITNGKGLDYLAQQWDLVNDNADDYLDTVNAAFSIRQLESKYQDAIDATDNVSSQRKLNELMEKELKALREKDKLSEYDVERANMKYEIALKQIALEEAQQTKNTMRLRRDSQGNYRYEYVADEEAISKLQDELDVLENSLYNFDKERWIEMQNQVVDAVQERQDAIKEIMIDASLTEEERAERLVEINRLYNEKIQNITDQTVEAQKNLYESGTDELEKDFGELSAEQGRIMVEEMLPQFNTGVNEMIDKFSGPGGFEDLTVQSMENLSNATQNYRDDLNEIEDTANVSFNNIRENIDDTIPKTEELIRSNEELNDEYITQIENIKKLNEQLAEQIKKYEEITKAAKEATVAAYEYWAEQQRQDAAAAEEAKTAKNNGGTNGGSGNSGTNSGGSGSTDQTGSGAGSGNGTPDVGEYATYIGGTYYSTSNGQGSIGQRGPGKRVKITAIAQGAAFPIHVMSNDSAYGWLKKSQLSGYDTGGYTGEWAGGYGKLAMLHSKELVLNAHDTENMLNMMQIARDVIALAGPRAGVLSAGQGANATAGQLEQNVHIEANFPNVESASEIEEALNNLVQLASQRANRNTRG